MGLCGSKRGVYCTDYCVCEEIPARISAVASLTNPNPPEPSFGWCYLNPRKVREKPELVAVSRNSEAAPSPVSEPPPGVPAM